MYFSEIFGHEAVVRSLQRALTNGQVAGTYLFVGPQGVGKTSVALAFARAAACLSPVLEPFEACGRCDSCQKMDSGSQTDIIMIPPAGDQTQIWQFWDRDNRPRGVIQHSISYAPTVGKRRIYIIERADTLTESAANSLLKVLEEPPDYACFILLAPQLSRLLPTIISRSQILRLQPSTQEKLTTYLEAKIGLETVQAEMFSAYSEGRAGMAIRLAKSSEVQQDIEKIVSFSETMIGAESLQSLLLSEQMRKLAGGLASLLDTGDAKTASETGTSKANAKATDSEETESGAKEKVGRRQLGGVIELIAGVYLDCLAIRLCGSEARIVHTQYRKRLELCCQRFTPVQWQEALTILLSARRKVDQNIGIGMVTDWLAVRLVNL